jgi:hypothetical protein
VWCGSLAPSSWTAAGPWRVLASDALLTFHTFFNVSMISLYVIRVTCPNVSEEKSRGTIASITRRSAKTVITRLKSQIHKKKRKIILLFFVGSW